MKAEEKHLGQGHCRSGSFNKLPSSQSRFGKPIHTCTFPYLLGFAEKFANPLDLG
jgi:hypothetical protein